MGLATIMPAWLAALLVCAVCLIIAAIGALIGQNKFKKVMPLVPEETIRGLKYDLGIAKEGSAFDPAVLDPELRTVQGREGRQGSRSRQGEGGKGSQGCRPARLRPAPTEAELRAGWTQRRTHLTGVRDDLGRELDIKTQARALLAAAQARLQEALSSSTEPWSSSSEKTRGFRSALAPAPRGCQASTGGPWPARIKDRWKPLAVLAASGAALAVLVRKLIKG